MNVSDGESDTVIVRVWYDGNPGWMPEVQPRIAAVTAPGDCRFVDAMAATFGPAPEGNRYSLVVRDGDATVAWLGEFTEHVTVAEVARVAEGQMIQIDVMGRGGGIIPLVWEMVEAGLTIASVVEGGRAVSRKLTQARYRNERQAAQDWVDAGTESDPSMPLRQAVHSASRWVRSDFDRKFELEREPGSKLLRVLGFEKVSTDPETWAASE